MIFKIVIVVLIILVVVLAIFKIRSYCSEKHYQKQIIEQCKFVAPTETIFVSIPNYRDSETPYTIYHLFSQAFCPYQIFIGLCSQTNCSSGQAGDDNNIIDRIMELSSSTKKTLFTENLQSFFQNNIRVESVPAELARGPVMARVAIERKLYAGEKYFMMIDSHMRFSKGWDKKLVETLNKCPSDKPILTMYPTNYVRGSGSLTTDWEEKEPPSCLYTEELNERGFPLLRGRPFVSSPVRPTKQLFWTPCFSFTYAVAHKEVPYDPHLRNLFVGEEISMSARFWTHGWDFYAPMSMVCKHLWDRNYRPTFWELGKSPDDAEQRVQYLLNIRPQNSVHERIKKDITLYGLGSGRSLGNYEKYVDIKLQKGKLGKRAKAGISPEPPNDEILAKFGSFNNLRNLR